jgi:transposase InsO family protein
VRELRLLRELVERVRGAFGASLCRAGRLVQISRTLHAYTSRRPSQEGLPLRHRLRRRKHASLHRGIAPAASRAHERWSMDLVHDLLIDGRAFRVLTVVDQCSRWSPILEVAKSMSGEAVAAAPDPVIAKYGKRRDECLNANPFLSIDDPKCKIEA